MINVTLLACPYCGTKRALRVASRLGDVDDQGFRHTENFVYCDPKTRGALKGCGAQGASCKSWDDAVLHWNRRLPEVFETV